MTDPYIEQTTSRFVFEGLELGQQRILKFLAKDGQLNQKELGERTSKYTMGFDRWGVKKRLEGTKQFIGLIPYEYVINIPFNNKESKYLLSLKGLFSTFQFVKFEDQFLIKRYKKILERYVSDQQLIQTILSMIKFETAYFLYYIYLQGLNWLRFRFIRISIEEKRTIYRGNFNLQLTINEKQLTKNQMKVFHRLQKEYAKLYLLAIYSIGFFTTKRILTECRKEKFNPKVKKFVALYQLTRFWPFYIDHPKINRPFSELVSDYLQSQKSDFISYLQVAD